MKTQSARISNLLMILLLVPLWIVSCGSGGRTLISISVSPASANGADYPLGGVQFTATGTYNKPPTTVTPLSASWSITPSGIATIETNTGFAQCASTGTATITASVQASSGIAQYAVFGSATLTCQ